MYIWNVYTSVVFLLTYFLLSNLVRNSTVAVFYYNLITVYRFSIYAQEMHRNQITIFNCPYYTWFWIFHIKKENILLYDSDTTFYFHSTLVVLNIYELSKQKTVRIDSGFDLGSLVIWNACNISLSLSNPDNSWCDSRISESLVISNICLHL